MRPDPDALAAFQAAFRATLLDRRPDAPSHAGARRLRVHRDNVVLGLIRALRSRFPVALRIVGDDFFNEMARRFVLAWPPRSAVLLHYGTGLADFAAALPETQDVPYLPDVLRLETAWSEAYHAADAAAAGPDDLAALAGRVLADVRVDLHPSARLLRSVHPVVTLWRLNRMEAGPGALDAWAGEDALIVRPRLTVDVVNLPPGLFEFLTELAAGQHLGAATEAALNAEPRFDAAGALAALISTGAALGFRP